MFEDINVDEILTAEGVDLKSYWWVDVDSRLGGEHDAYLDNADFETIPVQAKMSLVPEQMHTHLHHGRYEL